MKPENAFDPADEFIIDVQLIRKGSLIIRAIKHKVRLQILQLLHEHKRLTVTEIYEKLQMEQSIVSQHLATLRKVKVVFSQREGKKVFYTINYIRLNDIQNKIQAMLQR
jgi:ArsR family transcriptional regulator, virulence genes transcriptional regulator